MSVPGHIWRFSLEVPATDVVHGTVHAFLRTSEHGSWTPDDEKPSDAFVLHYRLGTWKAPPSRLSYFLTGLGTYEEYVRKSGWDGWKNAPVHLSVAFRPVPTRGQVKILLEYQLSGPDPVVIFQISASSLSSLLFEETEFLSNYLRENLDLPALPSVARL